MANTYDGSNISAPPSDLVWKPGAPADINGNEYENFRTVVNALQKIKGRKRLLFDGSLAPLLITDDGLGPYDMLGIQWGTHSGFFTGPNYRIRIGEGVELLNARDFGGFDAGNSAIIQNEGSTSPIRDFTPATFTAILTEPGINSTQFVSLAGAAPLIDVDKGFVIMQLAVLSTVGASPATPGYGIDFGPSFKIGLGATVLLGMGGGGVTPDSFISDPGEGTLLVMLLNSGAMSADGSGSFDRWHIEDQPSYQGAVVPYGFANQSMRYSGAWAFLTPPPVGYYGYNRVDSGSKIVPKAFRRWGELINVKGGVATADAGELVAGQAALTVPSGTDLELVSTGSGWDVRGQSPLKYSGVTLVADPAGADLHLNGAFVVDGDGAGVDTGALVAGTPADDGRVVSIRNKGGLIWTLTPGAGDTVDGGASFVIAGGSKISFVYDAPNNDWVSL